MERCIWREEPVDGQVQGAGSGLSRGEEVKYVRQLAFWVLHCGVSEGLNTQYSGARYTTMDNPERYLL
jgi:hypothetical protein